MTSAPVTFTWTGDGMSPASVLMQRLADRQFTIGERYTLVEHHDRSMASHGHYFAKLTELWQTLPEALADEYPTAEHLRKKALIRTGFADERSIVCASKAEAARVAAFIRPMDHFAIVVSREAVVRVYAAQSQSMKAMGRDVFQRSKDAVLQFAERLVAQQEAA